MPQGFNLFCQSAKFGALRGRARPMVKSYIVAFMLAGSLLASASATELKVTLTDSNGEPLPHAVVSVPVAESNNAATPAPTNAIMDQINTAFEPHVLAVPAGTQVRFPNSDNIRHHVYSFSKAKTFETKLYADEARPTIEFDTPGIVALGCNIHDQMRGYIYVSPHADSQVTNAAGEATLSLDGPAKLLIWHPWLQEQGQQQIEVPVSEGQSSLTYQLDVQAPAQAEEKPSKLQQRFNRRGGND